LHTMGNRGELLMATIEIFRIADTYIDLYIDGLENPENQYDNFGFVHIDDPIYDDGLIHVINVGTDSSYTSPLYRYSNLSKGITYTFEAWAKWNGIWYRADTRSISTSSATAYVRPISIYETTLVADIANLSNPQNQYEAFRFSREGWGYYYPISVDSGYTGYDSPNCTYGSLTGSTDYTLTGEVQYDGILYVVKPAYVTTDYREYTGTFTYWYPYNGQLNLGQTFQLTVKANYDDGSQVDVTTNGATYSSGNTSIATVSATGLISAVGVGTTNIWIYYSGGSGYFSLTVSDRPPSFNWSSGVYSGATFNMPATEWNNFLQNIRDVYSFKGWSLSGFPLTNVVSGLFYATRFNEAKNAIGSKNATGILDKNTGDTLYASDFTILTSRLNSIT